MLTITTTDALETVRARVAIVLQAILVATNVCGGALQHTLLFVCHVTLTQRSGSTYLFTRTTPWQWRIISFTVWPSAIPCWRRSLFQQALRNAQHASNSTDLPL